MMRAFCFAQLVSVVVVLNDLIELENLEEIRLAANKLSDNGLLELDDLTNLTTVHLNGTKITDVGLKTIHNRELVPQPFLTHRII